MKQIFLLLTFSILISGVGLFAYFSNAEDHLNRPLTYALSNIYAQVACPQFSAGKVSASAAVTPTTPLTGEVSLPKLTDWVDYGPVLEAGVESSWDFQWAGATPASVVKKDGMYYFYYVAVDGYRSHDGGPRHRAIGVATSQDGIHFTKYSGNPIMTHAPFNGEEEGANSAGINLDTNGNFVMYYGAAAGEGASIIADGRLAVSSNGLDFTDVAVALQHDDPCLHGYGDEIFPVATFQHNGQWYVYYQPNGGSAPRTLGLVWGPSMTNLPNSVKVLDGSPEEPVGIWGNVIWVAPDKIALFVQKLWWPDTFIEVRTASPNTPQQLSEPVERYDIPNLKRGTVFLDRERRTWFMYYTDFDRFWDVKLAPAGDPDLAPPTTPTDFSATAISHDKVELSWSPATDSDTGVVAYNIYRNGSKVGRTTGWTFTDVELSELRAYTYTVSALNFHGVEGPLTQTVTTTLADTTPPTLLSATMGVTPTQVVVRFSEPVDDTSAENIANYTISKGITITNASLEAGLETVILTTSEHTDNISYTLTINNVLDRATTPNLIAPDSQELYTYSPITGLVGFWTLDQDAGTEAIDESGYGNDGLINGATWQDSRLNQALYFDGVDDYVLVDDSLSLENVTEGSFTFVAWVKPQMVPPGVKGSYGVITRVGSHPAYFFGLSYGADRKYQAQLIDTSETFIRLTTPQISPGGWHHLAMVVDDTAKQLHLYVYGWRVSGSPKHYSGTLINLDEEVGENYRVGEYYIGSVKPDQGAGSFFTQHFKGWIDDVRIYNRALSPAEIYALFKQGGGKEVFLPRILKK